LSKQDHKLEGWCTFLKQNASFAVLANYKEFESIEGAVLDSFAGNIIELQRWDQGRSTEVTHIVEWQKEDFVGKSYYTIALNNDELLWIIVYVRQPVPIRLESILACLGNPDYYAVKPYLFPFEGYNESVDNVFLYYVEQDMELQVIKPQSKSVYDVDLELHFTEIHMLPSDQLFVKLMNLTDYPSKDDLKVWEEQ